MSKVQGKIGYYLTKRANTTKQIVAMEVELCYNTDNIRAFKATQNGLRQGPRGWYLHPLEWELAVKGCNWVSCWSLVPVPGVVARTWEFQSLSLVRGCTKRSAGLNVISRDTPAVRQHNQQLPIIRSPDVSVQLPILCALASNPLNSLGSTTDFNYQCLLVYIP